MTAKEFIKKEYPFGIDKYPMTELNTARLMEAYHKAKVEAISDEEIFSTAKEMFPTMYQDKELDCQISFYIGAKYVIQQLLKQ